MPLHVVVAEATDLGGEFVDLLGVNFLFAVEISSVADWVRIRCLIKLFVTTRTASHSTLALSIYHVTDGSG